MLQIGITRLIASKSKKVTLVLKFVSPLMPYKFWDPADKPAVQYQIHEAL